MATISPTHFEDTGEFKGKQNLGKKIAHSDIFFWGGLVPSVAQLSSAFPYFSCFPNAADMLPSLSSSPQ